MTETPNIKFINLGRTSANALPEDIISLYIDDKNSRRITLNKTLTKRLKDEGFRFLRVGFSDVSTDAYFVFCKEQTSDALMINPDGKNLVINSKFLVDTMVEKMGLSAKSQLLKITDNIANKPEYLTFRVNKA